MTIQALLHNEHINQRTDLIGIVRAGIETKYLKEIQEYTSLSDNEIGEVLPISQRQLVRYASDHRLNKEITSHLLQIIELYQKGYKLFGKVKFNLWLRTQNKVLGNIRPLEMMDTSIGIEMIEDVIGRIEHGVYS
jgi:putative toxin-antitoxin system antitoxin component (TIGR02293 family)